MSGEVAGKLMIAGEYAILRRDVPCVAVAASRVIEWHLGEPSPQPSLELDAFGRLQRMPLDAMRGDRLWDLARGAIGHLAALGLSPTRDLRLRLGGVIDGQKVGLGGSAAFTVALQRAIVRANGLRAPAGWLLAQGHAIHAAAQGGRGSGYDIATIAHGGCLAWRRGQPDVTRLRWPDDLHAAALFSGASADTSKALTRGVGLDAAGMDAVSSASDALRAAWQDGATGRSLLPWLARCEAAFSELVGRHPHLRTDGMTALAATIEAHGAIARTSGAGGGDCVLALSDDPARIEGVVAAWKARGGHCVARLPRDLAPIEEGP